MTFLLNIAMEFRCLFREISINGWLDLFNVSIICLVI